METTQTTAEGNKMTAIYRLYNITGRDDENGKWVSGYKDGTYGAEHIGPPIQNNTTGIGDHETGDPSSYEFEGILPKLEDNEWIYRIDGQPYAVWFEVNND